MASNAIESTATSAANRMVIPSAPFERQVGAPPSSSSSLGSMENNNNVWTLSNGGGGGVANGGPGSSSGGGGGAGSDTGSGSGSGGSGGVLNWQTGPNAATTGLCATTPWLFNTSASPVGSSLPSATSSISGDNEASVASGLGGPASSGIQQSLQQQHQHPPTTHQPPQQHPDHGPPANGGGGLCNACHSPGGGDAPARRQMAVAHCKECKEDLCGECVRAHQMVRVTRAHELVRIVGGPSANHHQPPSHTPIMNGVRTPSRLQHQNPEAAAQMLATGRSTPGGPVTPGRPAGMMGGVPHPPVTTTAAEEVRRNLELLGGLGGHPQSPANAARFDRGMGGSGQPSGNPLHPMHSQYNAQVVVTVFERAVERARDEAVNLLRQTNQKMSTIEETLISVTDMENRINAQHKELTDRLKSSARALLTAIETRERHLMARLDQVKDVKLKALKNQNDRLNAASMALRTNADNLAQSNAASGNGDQMRLINNNSMAEETLRKVEISCAPYQVNEDDVFEFVAPDAAPSIIESLSKAGHVSGSAFAPASTVSGDILTPAVSGNFGPGVANSVGRSAILDRESCFHVVVRDQLQEPRRTTPNNPVAVTIVDPDGRSTNQPAVAVPTPLGAYKVSWTPSVEGVHTISVTIRGLHVQGGPFSVRARAGRNYATIGVPKFEFGTEGENDGQLCRPWGVCCSREGLILVANRSNNRIEVYKPDGTFSHKFGTTGNGRGQFDRPASVICDKKNRAIVADKDNHRVQIFTVGGEFILVFGEKGARNGQFNYPWDVACNSRDQILVSDTRNHRIQLFSPQGDFVNRYGYEGASWRHFDSPRGICFTADDRAVVTDFNNHRLLVVNPDFAYAQFLGGEGTDPGQFTRPNGVAVDEEGHIVVADSRNNRVQIFNTNGVFVNAFGTSGTGPGEFDRPCGVCISPRGEIIVVDFGNSRVQVF